MGGGILLESSARSSGEFGTKIRVSVLVCSPNFLLDIGDIRSDNLRVVAKVRTVREGPTQKVGTHGSQGTYMTCTALEDDIWSIKSRRESVVFRYLRAKAEMYRAGSSSGFWSDSLNFEFRCQ